MCTTALQMIERLETLYGRKAQSSKDGLRMQFFSFMYDDNKTVVDNCLAIDGLAQELRAAGEEIRDAWVMSRILNSLPEKFNHFHSAWESLADVDKTLSKIIERPQQEQPMKSRESQVENALLTRSKAKFGNKSQYKKSQGKSQSKSVLSSSGQLNAGDSVVRSNEMLRM